MKDSSSPPQPDSPAEPRPESLRLRYLGLLKNNANFRRLWLAQFVSEIGDWFYSLAVYDLLFQLTGSGTLVGGAIIVQMLPWFFMIPLAGIVTDRFSRRRVMIVADLFRAVIVLGLLTVNTREEIWLIYVLLFLEVAFAAVFEPARNGLLPDLLKKKDLLPANAIASATWSLNLTLGAALGGLVAAVFGRKITFLLNSASFIASAVFLNRIAARETHLASAAVAEKQVSNSPQRWTDSMREVLHYLRQHKPVAVTLLAKTGLGAIGGSLLLLVLFGQLEFKTVGSGLLGMSLLYASRGAGALIGPFIGESWVRGRPAAMRKVISLGFFLLALGYLLLSQAPNLPVAAAILIFAHMGGSNVWVMSTSLLHLSVPSRLRGRVFAMDMGLHTLVVSLSNFLIGKGKDRLGLAPRALAAWLGVFLLLPAILWTLWVAFGKTEVPGAQEPEAEMSPEENAPMGV